MAADTIKPLPGYPTKLGNKNFFIGEITGPTLYATGGRQVNARTLGWGGFDKVSVVGRSLSGTYYGLVQYLPVDAAPSVNLYNCASVKIVWMVFATGAEAGAIDLSGEIMRFEAIGV